MPVCLEQITQSSLPPNTSLKRGLPFPSLVLVSGSACPLRGRSGAGLAPRAEGLQSADLARSFSHNDSAPLRQTVFPMKIAPIDKLTTNTAHVIGLLLTELRISFVRDTFAIGNRPPYELSTQSGPLFAFKSPLSSSFSPADVQSFGPITQTQLLAQLGINTRVEKLLESATEEEAEALEQAYLRLVGDQPGDEKAGTPPGMGAKYKAVVIAKKGQGAPFPFT